MDEARERVFVFCCCVVGAAILRVTLAEVTVRFPVPGNAARFARVDLLEGAVAELSSRVVRTARLERLLEGVDTERVCEGTDRPGVAVLATSTVRFTGRDRLALLRVERLETDRDGADDPLDGKFGDREARGLVD